jgi:hypothetical protein
LPLPPRVEGSATGANTRRSLHHLFRLIGADPNTAWLSQSDVEVDDKGFTRAGAVGEGAQVVATLHHASEG